MAIEKIKQNILKDALSKLRENTGLVAEVVDFEVGALDQAVDGEHYQDAVIKIQWNDQEYQFVVEIKNIITRAILGVTVHQFNRMRLKEKGMLIAKYVNPIIAEELKKSDVSFIDAVGNAYINKPPLFIYLKGNRPVDNMPDYARTFRPTGLQIIFALLCNPGLENKPYRYIAKKADVALGTVGEMMDDLKKTGYLIHMGNRLRRLIRKNDLLNRWVTAYPEKLRRKKMIGHYTADDGEWWKNAKLIEDNVLWGGEVAAYLMTEHLKPQTITLYTKKPIAKFLLTNKLMENKDGDTEILEIFWNFGPNHLHDNLVPPLLVYTDLMASGDARNIETARIIYDKKLSQYFRED